MKYYLTPQIELIKYKPEDICSSSVGEIDYEENEIEAEFID